MSCRHSARLTRNRNDALSDHCASSTETSAPWWSLSRRGARSVRTVPEPDQSCRDHPQPASRASRAGGCTPAASPSSTWHPPRLLALEARCEQLARDAKRIAPLELVVRVRRALAAPCDAPAGPQLRSVESFEAGGALNTIRLRSRGSASRLASIPARSCSRSSKSCSPSGSVPGISTFRVYYRQSRQTHAYTYLPLAATPEPLPASTKRRILRADLRLSHDKVETSPKLHKLAFRSAVPRSSSFGVSFGFEGLLRAAATG